MNKIEFEIWKKIQRSGVLKEIYEIELLKEGVEALIAEYISQNISISYNVSESEVLIEITEDVYCMGDVHYLILDRKVG